MSDPFGRVDPAYVGEFVEACDRALVEIRKLETAWRETGDQQRVDLAERMTRYIAGWRQAALDGRLPMPSPQLMLGISRFTSDYEWGPHGEPFIEAANDAERIWSEIRRFYPSVDSAVTGEFVAACERAIAEARTLEAKWRTTGDLSKQWAAEHMARFIGGWQWAASEGSLHPPSSNLPLGIMEVASQYSWGPEADALLEAAREVERVWKGLD